MLPLKPDKGTLRISFQSDVMMLGKTGVARLCW
jgi:hypothetical protein